MSNHAEVLFGVIAPVGANLSFSLRRIRTSSRLAVCAEPIFSVLSLGCYFKGNLMIRKVLVLALCCGAIELTLTGCGGTPGGDLQLVAAGGTVKLNGNPLEGATVNVIPEKGPLATGVTNKEGKFSLATGASPGAAIGPCQVTVTAYAAGSALAGSSTTPNMSAPPKNEEEVKQRLQAMDRMKSVQAPTDGAAPAGPKLLVNAKFGNPKSSGLTATIDKDPAKNQFTFDVTE